jgi:uncharacterized protein YjgD (DUF1641 family)
LLVHTCAYVRAVFITAGKAKREAKERAEQAQAKEMEKFREILNHAKKLAAKGRFDEKNDDREEYVNNCMRTGQMALKTGERLFFFFLFF